MRRRVRVKSKIWICTDIFPSIDKYELEAKRWVYLWKQTGPYISLGITEISCINTGPPTAASHLKWETSLRTVLWVQSSRHEAKPLSFSWAGYWTNQGLIARKPGLMTDLNLIQLSTLEKCSDKTKTPNLQTDAAEQHFRAVMIWWQYYVSEACLTFHLQIIWLLFALAQLFALPLFSCLCAPSLSPAW